jgi:hypothetical protein
MNRATNLWSCLLCCLLCCPLLLATQQAANAAATPKALQVKPGTVQYHETRGVSGSFKLVSNKSGLWSTGTGGGCLLADFSASIGVHACTTQTDCDAPLAELKTRLSAAGKPAEAHGYCTRAAQQHAPRTCWFRPGPRADYCFVSPTVPLTINQAVQLPKSPGTSIPALPLGDGKPVRWMVYTCLNAFDFGSPGAAKDHPGCAMGKLDTLVTEGGKAKTIKP